MRMLKIFTFLAFLMPCAAMAQSVVPTPGGQNIPVSSTACPNSSGQYANSNCTQSGAELPVNAAASNASATGTTAATTATIGAVAGKTNYLCSFQIRANATAAATGTATVTGLAGGTLSFVQWTAPLASGVGLVEEYFSPCLPASAANTAIAVVSAAPGAGGTVSVTAEGYVK